MKRHETAFDKIVNLLLSEFSKQDKTGDTACISAGFHVQYLIDNISNGIKGKKVVSEKSPWRKGENDDSGRFKKLSYR